MRFKRGFVCFCAESEKLREMAAATESPPKGPFHFNDDQEYPPLTQNSDWGQDSKDQYCKYQVMFGVILLIHFIVRISEDLIIYLFNLNGWRFFHCSISVLKFLFQVLSCPKFVSFHYCKLQEQSSCVFVDAFLFIICTGCARNARLAFFVQSIVSCLDALWVINKWNPYQSLH